jgi:hypothetical protein
MGVHVAGAQVVGAHVTGLQVTGSHVAGAHVTGEQVTGAHVAGLLVRGRHVRPASAAGVTKNTASNRAVLETTIRLIGNPPDAKGVETGRRSAPAVSGALARIPGKRTNPPIPM